MMVPVGRLTMVRTFPRSELVRAMSFVAIPALIGPMLGPLAGGLIVRLFPLAADLLRQRPYRARRTVPGLPAPARLPRRARRPARLRRDWSSSAAGIALLSYVLEVFGEHRLRPIEIGGLLAIAAALLLAYARHATTAPHPLLRLALLRIRTFRTAVGAAS